MTTNLQGTQEPHGSGVDRSTRPIHVPAPEQHMVQGTGASNDGSVTFSLAELMRLEEERVAVAREEEARRREGEARARKDEADRARQEEENRARLETERRRIEEERDREEAARLEGMQRALVERERLAAEQTARAVELDRLRAHEIELERLRQQRRRSTRLPWGIAAICVVVAIAGIGRSLAFVREDTARARTEADERRQTLEGLKRERAELEKRLEALKNAPQPACDSTPAVHAPPAGRPVRVSPPRSPPRPRGDKPPAGLLSGNCRPDDPLCAGN